MKHTGYRLIISKGHSWALQEWFNIVKYWKWKPGPTEVAGITLIGFSSEGEISLKSENWKAEK